MFGIQTFGDSGTFGEGERSNTGRRTFQGVGSIAPALAISRGEERRERLERSRAVIRKQPEDFAIQLSLAPRVPGEVRQIDGRLGGEVRHACSRPTVDAV